MRLGPEVLPHIAEVYTTGPRHRHIQKADWSMQQGARTLLVAPGITRNKKLLVTKGIATSNKGHYY